MPTLEERLNALATAIGTDVKALKIADGDLTALTTVAKNNLVAAINEVKAMAGSATGDVTEQDLIDAIEALRNELQAGAGDALDTFAELEAYLTTNASVADALTTAVANRVRFDQAQVLTGAQKTTALTNIGAVATSDIGNPDADLVAVYVAAKA